MYTRRHSSKILQTNFAFNYWWATQLSFRTVIMGQHLYIDKQSIHNFEIGDLKYGIFLPTSDFESQKNWLVGQTSSALPNPFRINPKNPKSKIDPKGKTCLATKRKLSYMKTSTIHFQPILFHLKVSAKASTSAAADFFLSCHPGVRRSEGLTPPCCSLLRSLHKQEVPHPQLPTKTTTYVRTMVFQRRAKPRKAS